jgi:hypothetical protein
MKFGRTLILTIIMALAVLPVPGCQGEPKEEIGPARLACIEMMQKVPIYYEDFEFWDVGKLREDTDLADLYQIWYERKAQFLEQNYAVPGAGVDYLAEGVGLLDIFKLDYDIDSVREKISAEFHRDTNYPDVEVLKTEPSHDPQASTSGWVLGEGLLVS